MKVITINALRQIINQVGLHRFLNEVILSLEEDLRRWNEFHKSPRHATHYPQGAIELMPCSDDNLYAFKYINGHPTNTRRGKLSVIGLGLLADTDSGYPLMLSEMTLLTAFRTAAVTALGAKYLARSDSRSLALVGTGAQAEFQVLACQALLPLESIYYYDLDIKAMDKFAANARKHVERVVPCKNIAEAVNNADIVITATAAKQRAQLISREMISPGVHIHALGGDCPGKTELDPELLRLCKIVVEYLPQSKHEGEIQNLSDISVHGELWELVTGRKSGRQNEHEITLFDAVGFALEDFSILRLVYQLASELGIGDELALIPSVSDPKNLFNLLDLP
ncbi:MAG: ornithine cyclodeaminase [Candidatus Thiodiazotropha sp. L084R]